MTKCKIDGCLSPALAKEMCRRHYMQVRRNGAVSDTRKNARKPCSEEGCELPAVSGGKCERHYRSKHRSEQALSRRAAADRTCDECGRPIPIERNMRARFCSVACKERYGNRPEVRDGRGFGPEYMRALQLRTKWAMTPAEYDAMLKAQGGRCAICGSTDTGWKGAAFHVDHCHTAEYATGKIVVRGLLCRSCNLGLGHFKDDVDTLLAAVEYLRRHREEAADLEGDEAEGHQAAG